MSWFFHVNQGSNQQPPDRMPSTTENLSSPSLTDFPLPPQGSVPLSLETLSCCSLNSVASRELMPLSYVTLQEQRCVLSWFLGWGTAQRERFLQDLLGKAVPGKVCTLLDSLSTLQVNLFFIYSKLCHVFACVKAVFVNVPKHK